MLSFDDEIREETSAAHMEIGFNKRQLAHRNVPGGIIQRIDWKSTQVAEDGEVV